MTDDWRAQLEAAATTVSKCRGSNSGEPFAVRSRDEDIKANRHYRHVSVTTQQMQRVLMYITPEDGGIEREVHEHSTQMFYIAAGRGKAIVAGKEIALHEGMLLFVPAGTEHEIINESKRHALVLETIYAPPVHDPGYIQERRGDE